MDVKPLGRVGAIASSGWAALRPWLWQVVTAILVIAFIAVIVRPFEQSKDVDSEDVALAWNKSIARLGISPVFPPEEDLHVGDVWAVIAEAKNSEITPILGKAVRIDRLDLSELVKNAAKQRPVFAETTQASKDLPYRKQERKELPRPETDDGLIGLTLAAFPGITITHRKKASGSLGSVFGGLGAARENQQVEEIRIPTAETYGVMANDALVRLLTWCNDEATKLRCSDRYVRNVLSYAVTPRVLDVSEGQYNASLQLHLVTRVFLTREIVQRRRQTDARGGAVQVSKEGNAGQESPGGAPSEPGDTSGLEKNVNTGAGSRSSSGAASSFRGDNTEVTINQVFQRPLVFGYRSVTLNLPPGKPQ
jgi:hypothetical protein